jgi:hypothetical protein
MTLCTERRREARDDVLPRSFRHTRFDAGIREDLGVTLRDGDEDEHPRAPCCCMQVLGEELLLRPLVRATTLHATRYQPIADRPRKRRRKHRTECDHLR